MTPTGIGLDCNYNGLSFSGTLFPAPLILSFVVSNQLTDDHLSLTGANHASRFGRVCAQRNAYDITVIGKHGFSVQQLDVEHAGPGQETPENVWQKTIADINDPKDLGYGDVTYWIVEGAVGPVPTFNKTGGANIQARRIGSALSCDQ